MKILIFPLNKHGLRKLGSFIYNYINIGITYRITIMDFDHKVVGEPILFKLENKTLGIIGSIIFLYENIITTVQNNDCNLKIYSTDANGYKEYYRVVYVVVAPF